MRQDRSRKAGPAQRRAWKSPTVTPVRVRAETGSAGARNLQHPEPPAPPANKLGFAFEMAFPLSARVH